MISRGKADACKLALARVLLEADEGGPARAGRPLPGHRRCVDQGRRMAISQAAHAFALFTGRASDTEWMRQYFNSAGEAPGGRSGAMGT